jgi:signal transduction histidine kinase
MRYPSWVAEIGRETFRAKVQAGIYTGYGTALFFGAIVWYASSHGVIPKSPAFAWLVIAKLVTNTLSWITLRKRVLQLEFAALNIAADLVVMTGAVYFTGGPHSPLLPIYFIEVAVMALLTNLGLTIVTISASFVLFTAMCALIMTGVIPQLQTPREIVGTLSLPLVVTILACFAISTLAPGAYIALIVQQLRQKELALEERGRQLLEAAREKSQFMVNVTHELRTPLHGVLGLSDLLRDGVYGPVTPEQIEAVVGIEQSARGLLELVDSLLFLARSEAAKMELTLGLVIPGEVIHRVAAAGRWLRGRKELAIEVNAPNDLPPLQTDRGKVAQILFNFLANAIKFTPEGGTVRVSARAHGDGVEIAVADTGIGIPEEQMAHIFDEFHQVDGSASRTYGGAGLGLAVVRHLAGILAGEVSVTSREGEGSTFTLRLPRSIDAPKPA